MNFLIIQFLIFYIYAILIDYILIYIILHVYIYYAMIFFGGGPHGHQLVGS